MTNKPQVGARVRWTSQANGTARTKEGVIYSGEPIYRWNLDCPTEVRKAPQARLHFDFYVTSGVIVRIPRASGKGADYYAPRLRWLELVKEVADAG